jgi:hypothetical protein
VLTDVTGRDGAEHRVGDGVADDVAVGMRAEPGFGEEANPSQEQRSVPVCIEPMHVEPEPNPDADHIVR